MDLNVAVTALHYCTIADLESRTRIELRIISVARTR